MKNFKSFLIENLAYKPQQKLDLTDPMTSFYHASIMAEHRGRITDPSQYQQKLFIRTLAKPKPGGAPSTAYGPAQITFSTAADTLKRYGNLMDDETKDYTKKFIEQGKKMISAGPNDKKYYYGGEGDLSGEEYNIPYQKMANTVIKAKLKDKKIDFTKPLNDEQLKQGITSWRGQSAADDPEYFKVFKNNYNKFLERGKVEGFNQSAAVNQEAEETTKNDIPNDDFIKSKSGYTQSPVDWSNRYPSNYDSKTMEPDQDREENSSSQTTPESQSPSTSQSQPSRSNSTRGKR